MSEVGFEEAEDEVDGSQRKIRDSGVLRTCRELGEWTYRMLGFCGA